MVVIKGAKTKVTANVEAGVYEATLDEVNCYTSEDFNTNDPQVNLTFVWNLGEHPDKPEEDLLYFDSFVTLYQDDEGYPVIGGKGGKVYKRLYGLFGREFDPTEADWDIVFPKQYDDDPEELLSLPHWKSYSKGDQRLKLRNLKLENVELIGKTSMIEIGNAKKPDGTYSQKLSVIDCKPLPKRRSTRRTETVEAEDAEEETALPV